MVTKEQVGELKLRKKEVKRMFSLTKEEDLQTRVDHLVTLSLGTCKMGYTDNSFSQELNKIVRDLAKQGTPMIKIMRMVGRKANKYKFGEESYRITHKQII